MLCKHTICKLDLSTQQEQGYALFIQGGKENCRSRYCTACGVDRLDHLCIVDYSCDRAHVSRGRKPATACPFHPYWYCFWPLWHRWCPDYLATAQEHNWLDPLCHWYWDRDYRFYWRLYGIWYDKRARATTRN